MRKLDSGRRFLSCILLSNLFCLATARGQVLPKLAHYPGDSVCKDYFTNHLSPLRKLTQSTGRLLLCELTPLAVDRYIRHMDYANISFQTIGNNVKLQSWGWDDDGFTTNQFGHPYHGSSFFNAFRSNGYNFWQSSLATFTGSYLWETVAENQPPAPNDFINTGFGGTILGEMTHRFANKIINNRARGFKRQAGEIVAFIINPVNGFARITEGKWGRVLPAANDRDSTPMSVEFDVGARRIAPDNKKESSGLYAHIKLIYGPAFENYKMPFSHIYINAELGRDDSSKLNLLSVYGSITGWQSDAMQRRKQLALLTANYDYIHNSAFFYSAQSLKFNIYNPIFTTKSFKVNSIAGAGPVLLAAVPDKHAYEDRYYDYCSGLGVHGVINAALFNRFNFTASFRGGWLKTLNGMGSYYFLKTVTAEIAARVFKRFFICAESGHFSLYCNYVQYKSVNQKYPYLRLSIRYSLSAR